MNIEMSKTSDKMNINVKKEELRDVYSNFDKFMMYKFMLSLLQIIGDMYAHIMSDEKEIEKEMGDE